MRYSVKTLVLVSILSTAQLITGYAFSFNIKHSETSARTSYGQKVVVSKDGYPVRSGTSSYRFEVRDGDCGSSPGWSDCSHDRERQEKKSNMRQEGWYHWSLFIPEDYKNISPTKVALGQFHQASTKHPILMFQNVSGGYYVDPQLHGRSRGFRMILTDEEMRGKWSDILVHAKFTKKEEGYIRVYVNGETEPRFHKIGRTSDGKSVYFKFGIYRSFMSRYKKRYGGPVPTQVAYFDDLKSGSKCSDVTKYFDCAKITKGEKELPQPRVILTYDRDDIEIISKFNCWLTKNSKAANLPSSKEIKTFANKIEDSKKELTKFKIRNKGLSQQTWLAHRDSILALVNHIGPVENYCSS